MVTRTSSTLRNSARLSVAAEVLCACILDWWKPALLALGLVFAVFSSAIAQVKMAPAGLIDSPIGQINQFLGSGQLDQATTVARSLTIPATTDSVRSLARLARALGKNGSLDDANEIFDLAISHHDQLSGASLPDAGRLTLPLHLAAISAAVKNKDSARILRSLRVVARDADNIPAGQRKAVSTIAFRAAADSLGSGNTQAAAQAYEVAGKLCEPNQVANAVLGQAWAMVVAGSDPLSAAQKLGEFVDRYPDHADAALATRACARCLTSAGREEDANLVLADLIDRWPDSPATIEVVKSHVSLPPQEVPDVIRRWLVDQAKEEATESWTADVTGLGLRVANHERKTDAAMSLTRQLAQTDSTGQAVADTLNQSEPADAETLAGFLISPPSGAQVTQAAREAAARWAGRNQRWSMLAMAAESESVERLTPGRSAAVERLFAEALMQTGRTTEAAIWWNHLVDHRRSTDFSTLLRCAEAETATGQDTQQASERIALARAAATPDHALSVTLVDLLEAELAIRRSRFNEARSLLENVVRGVETNGQLRGRAQWLIGETHFLQHHFSEAIDAYRRVEGIAPNGPWVAASMIQAGKSFEQLGRTREAAVCYGNLLGRFADSPHADSARHRMAALDPAQSTSSSQSIRR